MADSFDSGAAAVIYAASMGFSWAKALAVPATQAAASIKVLNQTNKMYRDIRKDQRELTTTAVQNYLDRISDFVPDMKAAYPDIPKVARYVPVDPCAEQDAAIDCAVYSAGRAAEWMDCINRLNNQTAIARAVFFDPKWVQNVDLYAVSVADLLRGRFSVDVKKPLLEDPSEMSAMEARMGRIPFKTSRNYGLSDLRSQATGRSELIEEAGMLEAISPVARQADMRDLMATPEQRISLALSQAQLVQNSLQNLLNRNAQKPPYKMAQLAVRLERIMNRLQLEASKATLVNTNVPNYTAILQPQINTLAKAFGDGLSNSAFASGL